jgi:hypothetical protein
MKMTLAGIVRREELNVPNPNDWRVSVIYVVGGPGGIYAVSPI